VKCSSETSIVFQKTTWRYIPEDKPLLTSTRCKMINFSLRPPLLSKKDLTARCTD
jgi:hypothetical protein